MKGQLNEIQGRILLELARKTLAHRLENGSLPSVPVDPALLTKAATFVTLKIEGKLRGCIGNLEPVGALWEGIRDNAINAAFHDHRFSALTKEELSAVQLDISILSEPKTLEYRGGDDLLEKLRPGIDGVIVRDGHRSATFLPQVWSQLNSAEQFLDHLCLKAGLPQKIWRQKPLVVHTYQVQCFKEDTDKKELVLDERRLGELESIYQQLQLEYERVAGVLNFSCTGCPDNCCDSYFLHHTYTEWAHLWQGVRQLTPERQQALISKAKSYLRQCESELAAGRRPQVMCPLNENGRCILYQHRLLVCRTHGVPASMTRPDGQSLRFPGCFRCQEIVESQSKVTPPHVERTILLQKLAMLEKELLDNKRHLLPKVKITIAEMLVKGPPQIPRPHCETKNNCS